MKFRFDNKEKLLTFGPYPDVGIKEARAKRDAARQSIREGVDPSGVRRRAQEAQDAERRAVANEASFECVARTWPALQTPRWAPVHAKDVIASLERDVFPEIGVKPIRLLDTPAILAALRKVEGRGSIETAKRLRQRISAVFASAISEGICTLDPSAVAGKALKPLPKKRKQPSITDPEEARGVLLAAEASRASPITKLASRLLALTNVRPAVVRGVTWDEFEGIDLTGDFIGPTLPLWRVPAARMKL